MVFIYSTGRRYKAKVKGQQPKFVTCEKCGIQFVYMMEREAVGTGRSLLWLDNSGAARRATNEAHRDLQRSFDKDCDAVPCPGCGSYQLSMARKLRGDWTGSVLFFAILLYIGGDILIAATGWHFGLGHPYLVCLGVSVLLYVLGITPIYMFFDANAKAEQRKAAGPDKRAIPRAEYEKIVAEQQRNAVSAPPPLAPSMQRAPVMPPPMNVAPGALGAGRMPPLAPPGASRPPPLPGRPQ